MKSCKNLKGGLQEVAEQLDLERIGPQHQAGSDSLLTGMAFFKMREVIYKKKVLKMVKHRSVKLASRGSHMSLKKLPNFYII